MKTEDTHSFSWIRIRAILLVAMLFGFGLAVAVKAFELQVMDGAKYDSMARDQYVRSFELPAPRGAIFDRNKHELAISHDVPSVFADPRRIHDAGKTALALARVLRMERGRIERRLKSKKAFVWIARRVGRKEADAVKRLKLGGIGLTMEPRRFYPNGDLAAQVLGFAGVDSVGLEGLEKQFDAVLKGGDQVLRGLRDALGRGALLDAPRPIESLQGMGLVLTIDSAIQNTLEHALSEAVRRSGSKAGTGIVMDPRNGDILAMATEPGFDPNKFSKYSASRRRNRSVTDCFEPGSIFKIYTYAAALDLGVVSPGDIINCENSNYKVSNHIIHDSHPHQNLTVVDAFKVSSNIAAAKIGQKLGPKRLYGYLRKFGFGSKTGISLPGETRGILSPAYRWRPINTATISFGQGVSVSGIQIVSATAAVANNGIRMKPRLVKSLLKPDGSVEKTYPPMSEGRVIRSDTAHELAEIMEKVTGPGGTGRRAAIPGFNVAGKTGTAQKVDPVAGGYSRDKRIGSFVGFVPVEKPRVVVLISMDEPKGVAYGGVVAAPVFAKVAKAALTRLGVRPLYRAAKDGSAKRERPDDLADGTIQDLEGPPPIPKVRVESGKLPDFSGLSMRAVARLAGKMGLEIDLYGTGLAVKQEPMPGTVLKKVGVCKVWFKSLAKRRKGA
ncbi:MAG: transpeptidase family protein [Deltaproteobacteria bacterium]|nr:transpeptidase family protein [Deltaproteobacteria bacterium]